MHFWGKTSFEYEENSNIYLCSIFRTLPSHPFKRPCCEQIARVIRIVKFTGIFIFDQYNFLFSCVLDKLAKHRIFLSSVDFYDASNQFRVSFRIQNDGACKLTDDVVNTASIKFIPEGDTLTISCRNVKVLKLEANCVDSFFSFSTQTLTRDDTVLQLSSIFHVPFMSGF